MIVVFKKGVSRISSQYVAAAHSLNVNRRFNAFSKVSKKEMTLIKSNIETSEELMGRLKNDPFVESVFPNYILRISNTPNHTDYGELWGMHNTGQTVNGIAGTNDADIDAPEAWDTSTGSSNHIIAVVDTGVLYTHPDLNDNMWKNPDEFETGAGDDDEMDM